MNRQQTISRTILFFIGLSFFYTPSAFAQSLHRLSCSIVFDTGTLTTSDERTFSYTSILSTEGQSTIVQISPSQVLRTFNDPNPILSTQSFVNGFYDMQRNGMTSLATILHHGTDWVIQEYVDVQMSLHDFLYETENIKAQSPRMFNQMVFELTRFALQTAPYAEIGDFHSHQLIWNGSTWLLLDWNGHHVLASSANSSTLFDRLDHRSSLTEVLLQNLREQILSSRRRLRLKR